MFFIRSSFCFVYRWWGVSPSNTSLLLSIDCVRRFFDHPIYVIDHSQKNHNWKPLKDRFNIKVFQEPSYLDAKLTSDKVFKRLSAKPFDLMWLMSQVREEKFVFLDSDAFVVSEWMPKFNGRFQSTGNTGVLIYENSPDCNTFFAVWMGVVSQGLLSSVMMEQLIALNKTGIFEDEVCYQHAEKITDKKHSDRLDNSYNYFLIKNGGKLVPDFPPDNDALNEPIKIIHIRSDSVKADALAIPQIKTVLSSGLQSES